MYIKKYEIIIHKNTKSHKEGTQAERQKNRQKDGRKDRKTDKKTEKQMDGINLIFIFSQKTVR